jgi:RNA polymerase sigma factor (sigma-70 family)
LTPEAVPPSDPLPNARPNHFGEAFDDLLGAAQADAGWAYERMFDAFGPTVLGYVRSQGVEDPEHLANDVFLRAFTNLGRFSGDEGAFRSWLFTIAHHAVIDERRRRSRRPVSSGDEVPDQTVEGAEEVALSRLGTLDVHALLGELSADQRDVLVLRLLGDLTVEQVARIVGKRPGAVKALQRRGLAALRRRLDGVADDQDG